MNHKSLVGHDYRHYVGCVKYINLVFMINLRTEFHAKLISLSIVYFVL